MNRIFIFLPLLLLSGCVSIQQPTVELSARVGERITEMERLHLVTSQRYFDAERQKVDAFLTDTWQPLFLKNFLATSGVLELLDEASLFSDARRNELSTAISDYLLDPAEVEPAVEALIGRLSDSRRGESGIVREVLNDYVEDEQLDAAADRIVALLGTDEPATIMMEFAAAAHEQIALQRAAMMDPIDQMEMEAMAALSASYAQMAAAQSHVTGRLEAAAKLSSEQQLLFKGFGVEAVSGKITRNLSHLSSEISTGLSVLRNEREPGTLAEKLLAMISGIAATSSKDFQAAVTVGNEQK